MECTNIGWHSQRIWNEEWRAATEIDFAEHIVKTSDEVSEWSLHFSRDVETPCLMLKSPTPREAKGLQIQMKGPSEPPPIISRTCRVFSLLLPSLPACLHSPTEDYFTSAIPFWPSLPLSPFYNACWISPCSSARISIASIHWYNRLGAATFPRHPCRDKFQFGCHFQSLIFDQQSGGHIMVLWWSSTTISVCGAPKEPFLILSENSTGALAAGPLCELNLPFPGI